MLRLAGLVDLGNADFSGSKARSPARMARPSAGASGVRWAVSRSPWEADRRAGYRLRDRSPALVRILPRGPVRLDSYLRGASDRFHSAGIRRDRPSLRRAASRPSRRGLGWSLAPSRENASIGPRHPGTHLGCRPAGVARQGRGNCAGQDLTPVRSSQAKSA
jgi:hypothetical protein